jgi:uncharacterized membrane protein
VTPFGMKNGLPTFQRVLPKAFKEHLHTFMKIFLDDFIVYNDMETHFQKFRLCFQKCREYNINLNQEKCTFMVFFGLIIGLIISKQGKLLDPKKIQQYCENHL